MVVEGANESMRATALGESLVDGELATTSPDGWQAMTVPERGATIGRYVVISKVGAGAMGVVLAAYDPELDRKVALKLLEPRGRDRDREAARGRLQREAQALAKLDHPNVVAIHDVGVHDGRLFMAMDFVEGQTLRPWMHRAGQPPRPWREVLRVFTEAGRGLAAAHEVGLIHRDFKPDNVMLGEDGRVRVMDFGLARADLEGGESSGGPETPDLEAVLAAARITGSRTALTSPLTRTGALLGTPAYMAPEQFEGRAVGPRADQFGFCVALYEALYGERPFPGDTVGELLIEMSEGGVRPAPRGSTVPGWVRKALLRGLAVSPTDRYPAMDELLVALAADPALRRRKWWAAAALLALVGGGGWGVGHVVQAQAEQCAGSEDKLAGVWDEDRRAELAAAIEGTKLSYAADTRGRVEEALDDYAARWTKMRTEACEATARGEQSEALLDRRMACLDDRLVHLRETVEVLSEADARVVEKAVEAVGRLPPLERCADTEALLAEQPPPEDREVAERVRELDGELARAKAEAEAGDPAAGLKIAEAVVAEAGALDHPPLQARALLRVGVLQQGTNDFEAAEASLIRAYKTALSAKMIDEAAFAATKLLYVVGYILARAEDSERWADDAEALVAASGSEAIRADLENSLGTVAFRAGDLDGAGEHFERTLEIREELGDRLAVAKVLNNFGLVNSAAGKQDAARDLLERSLAIREELFGPDHPQVASVLNSLGSVAGKSGEYAEARAHFERALAINEGVHGPTHMKIADLLHNLGEIAQLEGRSEQATAHLERALKIYEQRLGPEHPDLAQTLRPLGDIALGRGQEAKAEDYYARAVELQASKLGADHVEVAISQTRLGRVLVVRGRPDEALVHLEAAVRTLSDQTVDPRSLADARFALAEALWHADEGRERDRARELAELALASYEEDGEAAAEDRERAKAWLAERGD